jgi:hypothetical protein
MTDVTDTAWPVSVHRNRTVSPFAVSPFHPSSPQKSSRTGRTHRISFLLRAFVGRVALLFSCINYLGTHFLTNAQLQARDGADYCHSLARLDYTIVTRAHDTNQ